MPVFETISLTLGATIAKQIVKSWLGDGVGELSGELLDLLKAKTESSLAQRDATRRIEKIGEQVADKLRPVFEAESLRLSLPELAVVTQEVALTLAKTPIDAKLVLDHRFEAEKLARMLINSRQNIIQTFTAAEIAIYERFIREICKKIVEIASELSSFERYFSETILQSQDQILELVEKIYSRPNVEATTFENLYCKNIIQQLDRMELFGVSRMDSMAKRQSLSIAYVAIDVDQPTDRNSQLRLFDSSTGEGISGFDDEKEKSNRLVQQYGPIDQLLAYSRRIVVRGQAGSGKSTLLQWIAVRSASRDFPVHLSHWNNTMPFFIRLRERVNKGFPNPEEFPGLVAHAIAGHMPHSWVHAQLINGRAVVLIDGVDELPSTQRGEMLEDLQQLVSSYPLARYIVTSRPAALKVELWPEWQEWMQKEGFSETNLQPMSPAHIDNFIDQWHDAFAKTLSDEEEIKELRQLPDNLKRQLRQRPPLRRLADNPLLCAMICALHRERRQSLPAERIDLYKGCVEMLLGRRDEGRKIQLGTDYPNLSDSQKLVLAQSFAYWLMQNGYSDVELGEADRQFQNKLEEMNLPNVTGQGVRCLLVERANLLREPVAQRVDFAHRTFQEFLAAQAAVKENDIGVLIDHSRDDQWREMIILAAGEARPKEREKLLKGLFAKADKLKTERYRKQLYLLAVACLETCVELAPEVRQLVLDKAAPLFPPQDEDDIKLMAAAGDPALSMLAYNDKYSDAEAGRCVKTLAMIGSDKAMKEIAEYAGYSADNWKIRDEIGRAWRQFDRNNYVRQVLTRSEHLLLANHSSWEGFEHLSHMTLLILLNSQLTDLYPMRYFPNLRLLNLTLWNQLSDLDPLGYLKNLERLIIQNCENITDLAPLVNLGKLYQVYVHNCARIRDIVPLTKLQRLTQLGITELPEVDLSPIVDLQNLTSLEIRNVPVADPYIFEGLSNLNRFTLNGTNTSSFDFLSGLTELIKVNITNEQLDDLSSLKNLKSLQSLSIESTRIVDLSPLKNLKKLKYLNISDTNVTDLSPLANLTNLKMLYISGTPVKDLGPMQAIKGLKIIR